MRNYFIVLAIGLLAGCTGDDATSPAQRSAGDPSEIVQFTISAGGLIFDARAAGPTDGEVVFLLHGFPETSYAWRGQLSALGAAGYRVIAPNQRGYSASARPTDEAEYAMAELVGDVLSMADEVGAETFHLVGHDWGAGVAWSVAGAAPERLRTLTTMSVPHPDALRAELADKTSCQYDASSYFDFFEGNGAAGFLLASDAAQLRQLYAELADEAVSDYLSVLGTTEALDAALNWYRANIENRQFLGPDLGKTTVPTMFFWSDMDAAICPEGADNTGQYVSGPYQYEVVTGVSHWIPELATERVNELLLAHLSGGG